VEPCQVPYGDHGSLSRQEIIDYMKRVIKILITELILLSIGITICFVVLSLFGKGVAINNKLIINIIIFSILTMAVSYFITTILKKRNDIDMYPINWFASISQGIIVGLISYIF
jgi:hypothetical protein